MSKLTRVSVARCSTRTFWTVLSAALVIAAAAAAEEVGTIASVRGIAEIGRGGTRTAAVVGAPVELGDELRTGPDGQLRAVFRDDSVIDLTESSSLVVDEQVFDPEASRFSSLMRLVQGKARALVGKYYSTPGAAYEVQTPTAVAGVRGTTFMVAYNPDLDATEVIGIHGRVQVRSLDERVGESVYVTSQEMTTVFRDEAPTAPEEIEDRLFHHEIEGLEILAIGSIGTQATTSGLSGGNSVPATEHAPTTTGLVGQLGRDQLRNAGDVAGQPLTVIDATRGSLGVPIGN
jgi:hypothetical protein